MALHGPITGHGLLSQALTTGPTHLICPQQDTPLPHGRRTPLVTEAQALVNNLSSLPQTIQALQFRLILLEHLHRVQ